MPPKESLPPSTTGPHLKKLVVRHQGVAFPVHFQALFSWIRSIIVDTPSPLKALRVIADDGRICGTTAPLLTILAAQNLDKLDTLRLPHAMFKKGDLLSVLRLRQIKELEFYLWDPESIVICFFSHFTILILILNR